MRIALICNSYIYNYGSVLQSYALFKFLKKYDKEIAIVNYRDQATRAQKLETLIFWKLHKVFNINYVIDKILVRKRIKDDKDYDGIIEKRRKAYDKFVLDNFNFTEVCNSVQEVSRLVVNYDCLVLSSDQLWGPEDLIRGYHTLEFASDNVVKVAYATSFGVASLTKHFEKIVKRFVPHIDSISVREESGKHLIKRICDRDVVTALDPTMLLTKSEWDAVIGKTSVNEIREPYVFCYLLGNRSDNLVLVKELKNKINLKFASILHPEFYNKKEERVADIYVDGVGPAEFLWLIKNAEYIVTDSFHASVFSIHFRKKFIVVDRYTNAANESRNTRIEMLLETFDLCDRHCSVSDMEIDGILKKEIDWDSVYDILDRERAKAKNYLDTALGV